ncbi:thiamine diphosphokinase [Phyllobacterium phragmitis]|uniref:Thiamine diphosphokinase n=1 Tax=Phyllobacterium phragmitis TaxID=2670329 RepID=A0A2S9ITQ8_9HYPH|nr:thiamine diphosphokinase [Phyllobacterium phragmitis]PRD43909.1 thiamine diphosphokinase [Phyllobacterium phragmitis]
MNTFLILLGGHLTVTERLKRQIAGARVLAADSGMRHAAALGVEPELWLGDFDSTSPAMARRYKHVPRRTFPRAKDMTDGELALNEAFALGATSVILCGAFGGLRTDHTMLHLTMAAAQAAMGRDILLSSGVEEAWPIPPGTHAPDLPDGSLFSIIGFTELEGLTITSVEWPLDNVKVPFGSSLTVSNVVRGTLGILLRSGCGVLVATPKCEEMRPERRLL